MKVRSQKTKIFIAGAVALWVGTMVLQVFKQEGPDRANAVQVPLALMVLGSPALAYVLRRRQRWVRASLLCVQFGLYLLYETGISINTNIRIDLGLIYPAILFTAWIALRPDAIEEDNRTRVPVPEVTLNTKTRIRVACICFLICGTFALSYAARGPGMTVAWPLGCATIIALFVGSLLALKLWRSMLMKVLLIATVIFTVLFVCTPPFSLWDAVLVCGYGALTIVVSILALIRTAQRPL